MEQNGLEQWLANLKNVVEIWKFDPEIKTIVENISDFNWQSLSDVINDSVNFINGEVKKSTPKPRKQKDKSA